MKQMQNQKQRNKKLLNIYLRIYKLVQSVKQMKICLIRNKY
ncbi:unnamed protein product [Paramecium sonneborni]|uniref:Uncharacterized protein n=1 Tax=Paramecium sonneborni TaxID=65129 RepID=A0A8S1QTC0_9CILI|nr:unnamed protein product [Paramecium sonneborni]